MNRQTLGAIYDKSHGHCWYCGVELPPFSDWHIEHQIPRSKGGTNDLSNLVASCRRCNIEKSDRNLSEYEQFLITDLSNKVMAAMVAAKRLRGPDLARVRALLLEASRYLDDTTLVFWGDGVHDYDEHLEVFETAFIDSTPRGEGET